MARAVGVAIRANWVEVVEVQRLLKRVKVLKFGRFPILSTEKPKIAEAVKGALEAARIKTREVILAIPSQDVILRFFTLPPIPRHEWAGAVQFEVRKYIPFKLDELVWDFHINERKGQRNLDVIFVAARKEVFLEYLAILEQAGVKAVAVEAASFALTRGLLFAHPRFREMTFAVIDLSGDVGHVALVHQGIPQLARDVFLVGQSEPGSTPAVAPVGTLLQAPASNQEQQAANLLGELRLSLDYFAREFTGQNVGQIVLCGERADESWREALVQELKLPTDLLQPNIAVHIAVPSSGTLALGLALHGVGWPSPRVNFLRRDISTLRAIATRVEPQYLRWAAAELALAGAVLVGLHVVMAREVSDIRAQAAQLERTRAQVTLPVDIRHPASLRRLAQSVAEQAVLLETTVGEGRHYLTYTLEALARTLPQGIWLEALDVRTQGEWTAPRWTVALQGNCSLRERTRELELVNQLPQLLKEDQHFKTDFEEARIGSMSSKQSQDTAVTNFELQLTHRLTTEDASHAR